MEARTCHLPGADTSSSPEVRWPQHPGRRGLVYWAPRARWASCQDRRPLMYVPVRWARDRALSRCLRSGAGRCPESSLLVSKRPQGAQRSVILWSH